MVPLLSPEEQITALMGESACTGPLKAGDLVIFKNGRNAGPIIKRIHAVPGDGFSITDGLITVNGDILENSSGQVYRLNVAQSRMLGLYIRDYGGIIPSRAYLVMGEKPHGTLDSTIYGLIDRQDIIGVVQQ